MDCLQVPKVEIAARDAFQDAFTHKLALYPVELVCFPNVQPVPQDEGTGIDIRIIVHSAAVADAFAAATRFRDCSRM